MHMIRLKPYIGIILGLFLIFVLHMPAPSTAAVITGDIVSSSTLTDRAALPEVLHEVFARFSEEPDSVLRPFEIYRGDSFQGVVRPASAMRMAIAIRARLRYLGGGGPLEELTDARIAIGIGGITYAGDRVVESDGEAFQLSGRALDAMVAEKSRTRLQVETPWPTVQYGLEGIAHALDTIVGRWRDTSAQIMYLDLMEEGMNQADQARTLSITQPAVSQRLKTAQEKDVWQWLERYEKLIGSHLNA